MVAKKIKYPNLKFVMLKHNEKNIDVIKLIGSSYFKFGRKMSGELEWTLSEVKTLCEHYGKDYYYLFEESEGI